MRIYQFFAFALALMTSFGVAAALLIDQQFKTECALPLAFRWDVVWRDIPILASPWLVLALENLILWKMRASTWIFPAISMLLSMIAFWIIEDHLGAGLSCSPKGERPIDVLWIGTLVIVYPWMICGAAYLAVRAAASSKT